MCGAGQDRFQTLFLEATIYAIYLQCWPSPGSFIGAESRLAKSAQRTDLAQIFGFIKRCLAYLASLFIGELSDVILVKNAKIVLEQIIW